MLVFHAAIKKDPRAYTIMVHVACFTSFGTRRPKTKVWVLSCSYVGAREGVALSPLQATSSFLAGAMKLPAVTFLLLLEEGTHVCLLYPNVPFSQGHQLGWTRAHTHDLILT